MRDEGRRATGLRAAVRDLNRQARLIERVGAYFERANFGAYVLMLQKPAKIIWLNFLGGLARGVGIGVGFTLLAAAIVLLLQELSVLNLPVIGKFIADIVRIVQAQLHTPTI